MPNIHALKDHLKESQLYLNRTVAATALVIIVIIGLICRLIFLQVYQHDNFKTLSLNNQVRIIPITPPRGLIFDKNGMLLADNRPAYSLEITPERTSNIKETLSEIEKIMPLTDSERRQFFKQLKYRPKSEGIPVRIKLSEVELAKFSVEKHRLPGVDIVARLIRHYPEGELFAHALGYISPISERDIPEIDPVNYRGTYYIGRIGIEKFYEDQLHGKTGYQHVETNAKGRPIRVLKRISPTPGSNLHLSIDGRLQKACAEAFKELKGAIVAIDPNNGGVLALVSTPSFDPNLFTQGIDVKTFKDLQFSPEKPLFNRAIRGQYPPGSTIKPLVALKALEQGISPRFSIFDPGYYRINGVGRMYRDWIFHKKKHGHGSVDLEKAIVQSCDTYFFTIAHKLGVEALGDIYTRFGLGKMTKIDMTGEASGLVPSVEWKRKAYNDAWYAGDTLNIGIGQGTLLATPLQMAHAVAIVANRGKGFEPRMVASIAENKTTEPKPLYPEPIEEFKNIPKENWNRVIEAMRKVIHMPGGTAHRISQGLNYQMAGKTGTAQVFNLKQNERYEANRLKAHLRDHSWFIVFAPVDKPEIAVAVLIENKQTKTGADIARQVLDSYFSKPLQEISDTTDEDESEVGGESEGENPDAEAASESTTETLGSVTE